MTTNRRMFNGLLGGSVAAIALIAATGAWAAGPRIAYFVPAANSWTAVTTKGAKDTIEAAGGTMTIIESNYSAETQFTQVQDAITSGNYDGFIIMSVDGSGMVPYVEQAAEANIPVAVDTSVVGPDTTTKEIQVKGIVASVTLPASLEGASYAGEIIKQCGDTPCNVAVMLGSRGQTYDVALLQALKDTVKDQANIKIVAETEGGYASDPAYTAMRDVFLAHPEITMVVTYNDPMAKGVLQAADEGGIKVGGADGLKLISSGGSQLAKDLILEGRMLSSEVGLPYTQGKLEAEGLLSALKGEPVAQAAVHTTFDAAPFPFLNASNAADFKPEWAGE